MSRIRLSAVLVACVTAMSAVSSAQSRLFVFGAAGGAEVSLETGVVSAVDTHGLFAPDIVDGGRYLAAMIPLPTATFPMQRHGLRLWSPRTGDAFTAAEFAGELGDRAPAFVGDANRARVFVWNRDRITSVTAMGAMDIIANITPPPARAGATLLPGLRRLAYAPASEVLFVVRQGAALDDIELAQYTTDGTLLRAHLLPAPPDYLAVSSDGRRVFTLTVASLPAAPHPTLWAFDGVTGAEQRAVDLQQDSALGSGARGLLLDEAGERVLVPFGATPSLLQVLSFDLAPLQIIRYPTGQTLCRFDIAEDERTGVAAIVSTEWHGSLFGGARNPRVSLVNLATGSVIASAPLTNPLLDAAYQGCGGGILLLTRPPAPALAPPVVAGGTITLAWSAVRTATDYLIEAGPAPGTTVFTARSHGRLSITASVPAGIYYVRLRALNDSGAGPASSEIVVTVP